MDNNKKFIITIDTEGDNQWNLDKGISTENAKFLPRFQELSEKYGYKPVWLTNYEMANDEEFVKYMKPKQEKGLCEIGMHLHAWNNPPEYRLNKVNKEREYLIEYPEQVMKEKIENLTHILTEKFGIKPVSHRSGRWTTNEVYFKLLSDAGYKVDCSVTPHVSWEKCLGGTGIKGSDYKNFSEKPYFIYEDVLEVPMTIRNIHNYQFDRIQKPKNVLGECKRFIQGRNQWMRPDKYINKSGLQHLVKKCSRNNEYIMFMIHSSELMPGGSPNFRDDEAIQKLYLVIESVFNTALKEGYIGITLRDFYNEYKKTIN